LDLSNLIPNEIFKNSLGKKPGGFPLKATYLTKKFNEIFLGKTHKSGGI